MKICNNCGTQKPSSDFTKNHPYCKKCNSVRASKWNKENPDRRKIIVKKDNYKRRYGLSVEDKQSMIDKQNALCAICKRPLKSTHDVCVDHCHDTNKVRGILCRKCNLGIGHFDDSIKYLKDAIKYLRKWNKQGAIHENMHQVR